MGGTRWLLLVLSILGSAHAVAASPVLVSDGRQLSLSDLDGLGCAISETTFLPPAPFASFDESRSLSDPLVGTLTASQSSVVAADAMAGSGAASNTTGTPHFCATSTFSISFDVSASTAYEFSGTLTTTSDEAWATFQLTSVVGDEFDHPVYGFDSQDFEEAGALLPGRYTLSAFVSSGASNQSSWVFAFQLLPEPRAASLFGLAGLALAARVSRQRREARGHR